MLNHLSRAAQSAYFADASDITAIPLDAELKVFVGIKTLRVDGKLSHAPEIFFGNEMQAPDRPDTKTQHPVNFHQLCNPVRQPYE